MAEQGAVLKAMHDLIDAMPAEPSAPTGPKENSEPNTTTYRPRSWGVSLETGAPRAPTPAPTAEQHQIQPLPAD